jgi:hypothetical protein
MFYYYFDGMWLRRTEGSSVFSDSYNESRKGKAIPVTGFGGP